MNLKTETVTDYPLGIEFINLYEIKQNVITIV